MSDLDAIRTRIELVKQKRQAEEAAKRQEEEVR
jgi:hypothetical protein